MSSRKNNSGSDAILELAALLPWWGGVILAVTSYAGLRLYLSRPLPAIALESGSNEYLTQLILHSFASFGQIVLPFLFLSGAVISAVRRWRRRKLLADVVSSDAPDALRGLTWREFEMLVGEAFRVQGYSVAETGGGADGGVDVVLRKDGEKYYVQCKHWRASQVGVTIVRELYGAMAAHGATGGFVVTSGGFTTPAIEFARGLNLTLIDGPQLRAMIRMANRNVSAD